MGLGKFEWGHDISNITLGGNSHNYLERQAFYKIERMPKFSYIFSFECEQRSSQIKITNTLILIRIY